MPQSAILKGITTITWGSGSMTQNGLATCIVESISYKGKPVIGRVEGNIGTEMAKVLVDDGFDATIKLLYDSSITYPVLGDTISLKSPIHASKLAVVVTGIDEDVARKKEAMWSCTVEYRPDLGLTAP